MRFMMKTKAPTIVLTGGGSAGHVTPNMALIPGLDALGYEIHYIGTQRGIERGLIEPLGVAYHTIRTGKLRRYFSWQNFIDPLNVLCGLVKSFFLLGRIKPRCVFSKGGFVSLPVVIAARFRGKPVILHESDMTPGLANRLCFRFASTICTSFKDTQKYIKPSYQNKVVHTGSPVRPALLSGDKARGQQLTGFNTAKPVLMIICGSLGSDIINHFIRANLDALLDHYQIIHCSGKNKCDPSFDQTGYQQYDYVGADLPDLYALADCFISRAGANSVFELLALQKPALLIPLSTKASRGDQILNAQYAKQHGRFEVLDEAELKLEHVLTALSRSCAKPTHPKQSDQASVQILKLIQSLAR
jgi:UDP-N-acetylglucosamine--N-acetylmuramyl-(pentapeptide) pyrophosphoryl-undecaprenol N-acetylglucosamine transferase